MTRLLFAEAMIVVPSWAQPVQQSMGGVGQYDIDIYFWRLGMARDRVIAIE
jgi:hypothetical protein